MKRIIIASLFCLVFASCASLRATPVAVSTNTAQPISTSTLASTTTPELTATDVLMYDGLIMLGPNRYRFLIWSISFSMPKNWDMSNRLYMSPVGTGSSLQASGELYIFYRNNRINDDPKSEYPRIGILFEIIPSQTEIKTYSEDTLAREHGAYIVINQNLDPKELGLSIDTAIAYKSSSKVEAVEYTQYIIHAVYQTTGIEIIMDSETELFASFDSDFLYFLKNLSFG